MVELGGMNTMLVQPAPCGQIATCAWLHTLAAVTIGIPSGGNSLSVTVGGSDWRRPKTSSSWLSIARPPCLAPAPRRTISTAGALGTGKGFVADRSPDRALTAPARERMAGPA
eukprot:scaffold30644_cov67-Phaeocystis_antarctica.AAC.6